MFPSEIEAPQRSVTRSLLRGSVIWLLIGLLSGFLLAWVKRYPASLQDWGLFSAGRIQLYHGGLLLFGWAFPMLLGLWTLRLRTIRKAPLRFVPLWEGANRVWHGALVWGVVSAFWGQHSTWPTWVWMPVIYGSLAFAGFLYLGAVLANPPEAPTPHERISYSYLLVGLSATIAVLLLFLAAPALFRARLPALTHVLLALGLLFPLIGLVLPTAQQESYSTALSPVLPKLYLWAGLFLFPLSASVFSAQLRGAIVWGIAQFTLLALCLVLLGSLTQAWRHRQSAYSSYWQAGALCFLIAAIEGASFGVLRIMGNDPGPMWYSNHSHLLLAGCAILWLQGTAYQMFSENNVLPVNLKRKSRWILLGLLLMLLGGWLEAGLHLHLDQLALQRGILFPSGARTLRLVGGVLMLFPLLSFAAHTWQLTDDH